MLQMCKAHEELQILHKNVMTVVNVFLLARPSPDIFLPPLIPWVEQGGSSILLVTLLFDLCDDLTIIVCKGLFVMAKKVCDFGPRVLRRRAVPPCSILLRDDRGVVSRQRERLEGPSKAVQQGQAMTGSTLEKVVSK